MYVHVSTKILTSVLPIGSKVQRASLPAPGGLKSSSHKLHKQQTKLYTYVSLYAYRTHLELARFRIRAVLMILT